MNKSELVEAVANRSGISKADADKTISAFFDVLTEAVKGGDKVAWPGFGSFSTSQSAARTVRNPQTGEAVDIAASTRMKFTASSTRKSEMNPKRQTTIREGPTRDCSSEEGRKDIGREEGSGEEGRQEVIGQEIGSEEGS